MFGLVEMLIFIAILLVGYVYVWRKGPSNGNRDSRSNQGAPGVS